MSDLTPLVSFPSFFLSREAFGEAKLCLEAIRLVRVRVSMIGVMKMVQRDELVSIPVI